MKIFSKRLSKNLTVAIYVATVFLLCAQNITACSWDYLIWQNRSKNSDPYYRFVKNDKAGFINQSGKIVIEPTLWASGNYQDGVINGLLEADFQKYIDIKTGEEVSSDYYHRNINVFEGLSVKLFENKFGYVNRKGDTVIEPSFVYAKDFSQGLAAVVLEGPCFYYNPESPCPEADVFPVGSSRETKVACQFNFINSEEKVVCAQTFLGMKEFSEGFAPVKTPEGWGYMDKSGKIVITPQFEEAKPFSEGIALVKRNDLYGYINSTGAFVIKPQFESAESFSNGLAPVGKYGDETIGEFYYINKNGKPATSDKFLLASHYFEGLAHVLVSETLKIDKKDDEESEIRKRIYAYINAKGKKVFTYTIEDEM
jgi:hypothetical protein